MGSDLLVVVTGSRAWTDSGTIRAALDALNPRLVMHGDCRGADAIAVEWNPGRAVPMPADWIRYHNAAGPKRNAEMALAAGAFKRCGWRVVCLAFPLPGSRGTVDCMQRFRDAGFPVEVRRGK